MYVKAILALLFCASIAVAQPPTVPTVPIDPPEIITKPAVALPQPAPPSPPIEQETIQQTIGRQPLFFPGLRRRSTQRITVNVQREAVQAAPAPFVAPAVVAPTAEGSPWLSRAETEAIKAKWPKGVPFPATLRFYSLAPRYQNLWTMNNGSYKGWASAELHDEPEEFKVSGGMVDIPASIWRSAKGLDVPAGKFIRARKVPIDVRAFALVPAWQWTFDQGITTYDVLSDADGNIFEIRTRTQTDEGWESKVAFKDKTYAPVGYTGAGKACASCHGRTDETLEFSNRIYLTLRWGSGGVFSFRPWNEDAQLDMRWPLRLEQ